MFKRGILAGLLLAIMVATPATAAQPALDWFGPYMISPNTMADVDCPTTTFCIAVDVDGNAMTTSNPSGTATDWQVKPVTTSSPRAVSCSSPSLCVAVGAGGEVAVSTEPTGGESSWTTTDLGVGYLGAVDCGPGVCVALDTEGQFLISSDPTKGNWKVFELVGANEFFLSAIDCPSTQLCVAVGAEKHNLGGGFYVKENLVFTISNPLSEPPQVKRSYLNTLTYLRAISCPTTTFCAAIDKIGQAWTSTDPTGGTEAWTNRQIDSEEKLTDISCPTSGFCVAVDENHQALTSSNPTGGLEDWAGTEIPGGLLSVSCPSSSLCLAGGLNEVEVGLPITPEETPTKGSPPPPQEAPASIRTASLFLQPTAIKLKGNKATMIVTCQGAFDCNGQAKLESKVGKVHRFRTIASGSFDIHGRETITVKLNKLGRQLFKTKSKAKARVRLEGRSGTNQPISLWQMTTVKKLGK